MADEKIYVFDSDNTQITVVEEGLSEIVVINDQEPSIVEIYEIGPQGPRGIDGSSVLPSGIISGSSQVDYNLILNQPTSIASSSFAISASYAVSASYVSGSSISASYAATASYYQLPNGIISSSDGFISSSGQIIYSQIQGIPSSSLTGSGQNSQIGVFSGSQFISGSNSFVWSGSRLGIGTSTPTSPIDIITTYSGDGRTIQQGVTIQGVDIYAPTTNAYHLRFLNTDAGAAYIGLDGGSIVRWTCEGFIILDGASNQSTYGAKAITGFNSGFKIMSNDSTGFTNNKTVSLGIRNNTTGNEYDLLKVSGRGYGTLITPFSGSDVGLIIQGQPTQSANLQQWKLSSGSILSAVDYLGRLSLGKPSASYYLDVSGSGNFEGNLTVSNSINIYQTGSVAGTQLRNLYIEDSSTIINQSGISQSIYGLHIDQGTSLAGLGGGSRYGILIEQSGVWNKNIGTISVGLIVKRIVGSVYNNGYSSALFGNGFQVGSDTLLSGLSSLITIKPTVFDSSSLSEGTIFIDNGSTAGNIGGITVGQSNASNLSAGIHFIKTATNRENDIAFKASNNGNLTERIRILGSNGNVGIGTTAPIFNLDVSGSGNFDTNLTVSGSILIQTQDITSRKNKYIGVGTYGTISETAGGLAFITGNALRASQLANNKIVKTINSAGQFIRMRYDTGISFHTNVTGASGSEYNDNYNQRMLIDLNGNVQISSSLIVTGSTTTAGLTSSGGITCTTAGTFIQGFIFRGANNGSRIQERADGRWSFTNNAETDFDKIQLGGTTSASPAIAKTGSQVAIVLADASGYAAIQSLYQRFGSGDPNGSITAPVGAFYSRTDGGAGTSFYVKEAGTGSSGWVAK